LKHRYKLRFRREDIQTASGLLNALQQLFPDLPGFPDEELIADLATGNANHHAVVSDFSGSLRWDLIDEIQLAGLARLIELSLIVQDDIENAWMTCFIEAGLSKGLRQHLSAQAKLYIKTH